MAGCLSELFTFGAQHGDMLAIATALVRSVGRLATLPALFWFSVTYIQLLQPALNVDWGMQLPALHASAYMAALYLMIRLMARRVALEDSIDL